MTRKMAYIGSSYLIGLFCASFFAFGLCLFVAAAGIIIGFVVLAFYGKGGARLSACVVSAAVGVLVYGLYGLFVYGNIVKYDGYPVEVNGVIADYTDYSGDKSSYTVKGVINGDVTAVVTCYTDSVNADIGDKVTLTGTAERLKNSYTFPAEDYYRAKGIYLRVNKVSGFVCTPYDGFSLKRVFEAYRAKIAAVIGREMDLDGKAVMEAMLFGDKSGLESTQKTLMYRAGIGHIMAVSGVHLSVVCSFFWLFISRLPIGKFFRFGLLLIPIFCFVLLAGMSNSVVRAAVMIITVYGAELFKRRADTFNSLGIAVILLTLFSPFAVRDASFLLSVCGVFAIGVAAPEVIKAIEKKIVLPASVKSFIMSVCVTALIFPVSMLYFDETSAVAPISNLLLLPICEVILIGGIIVTLTGGAAVVAVPVLKICGWLCHIVLKISVLIGGIRFSSIPLGSEFVRFAVSISIIVVSALYISCRKADVTALAAVIMLSFSMLSVNLLRVIPNGKTTVAVFRDGKAVTAVVHNNRTANIIDLSGGGKAASSAVKYLTGNGVYAVEAVILNDGANTSIPVYNGSLELFDVAAYLLPERDKALAHGECLFYSDETFVETVCCEIYFKEDAVTVRCGETDILFYTDDWENDGGTYAAAVRYGGKGFDADPDTDIIAVMNENGEAVAKKGRTVYTGENVKMTVSASGRVSSEIIE